MEQNYQNMGAGFSGVFWVVWIALIVFFIVVQWKIYQKAGKPGWAAIIPIYNIIVMLQIVQRPVWWILLLLIPFVNIVISIILSLDLAKAYGKSTGFGIGIILLPIIFMPILAFGDAEYVGRE